MKATQEQEEKALLLNVRQVAAILGISQRSAWRMRDSGKMPKAIRPNGSCVRWRKTDILLWIENDCDMDKYNDAREACHV